MSAFYTADLHLGHANVIRLCNRPFQDVEEMDRALVANWNRVVSEADTVWVLGDVCLDKRKLSLVKELRGEKVLVAGNHDLCHRMHRRWHQYEELYLNAGFTEVWPSGFFRNHRLGEHITEEEAPVKVDLAHLPYRGDSHDRDRFTEWRPADEGKVLLCGHVHEAWTVSGRQVNVGVDRWDFTPVSQARLLPLIRRARAEAAAE